MGLEGGGGRGVRTLRRRDDGLEGVLEVSGRDGDLADVQHQFIRRLVDLWESSPVEGRNTNQDSNCTKYTV